MTPTITKYVDVFCGYDGEPQESDCFDTLNDAISNMLGNYDQWECWDDEKRPLASNSKAVKGNIIDHGHWGYFKLPYCLNARDTKIYFYKMEDLKHFEATLDTEEEREITDGTL